MKRDLSVSELAKREADRQRVIDYDLSSLLCPHSLSVCAISSHIPTSVAEWQVEGFQCVDFLNDLQFCGGCPTSGAR